MKPSLSVIIVNYRSEDALAHCLRSIHAATTAGVEIILADNSPGRGAGDVLTGSGLPGHYLPQRTNLHYSRAANIGAARANGDGLCFVSPDVVFGPRSLDRLVEWVGDRGRGVVGPRELDDRGRITTTAWPFVTRRYVLGMQSIMRLPWPRWLQPALSWLMPSYRYAWQCRRASEPFAAPVLSGSCLVMPRAVWLEVGPWHEDLSYFGLESEWFRRAREQGMTAWYVPAATVFHVQALSINRADPGEVRRLADDHRRWHARRLGWWVAAALAAILFVERTLRRKT